MQSKVEYNKSLFDVYIARGMSVAEIREHALATNKHGVVLICDDLLYIRNRVAVLSKSTKEKASYMSVIQRTPEEMIPVVKNLISDIENNSTSVIKKSGLCDNLYLATKKLYPNSNQYNVITILRAATESWEHFSGSNIYPVPATNWFTKNPDRQYHYFSKYRGKQKKLRLHLLNHLLKYLESFD